MWCIYNLNVCRSLRNKGFPKDMREMSPLEGSVGSHLAGKQ